jgi:hypothetical protein
LRARWAALAVKPGDARAGVRSLNSRVTTSPETSVEARNYLAMLDRRTIPAICLLGEESLMPERDLDGLPSLVDDVAREALERGRDLEPTVCQALGETNSDLLLIDQSINYCIGVRCVRALRPWFEWSVRPVRRSHKSRLLRRRSVC